MQKGIDIDGEAAFDQSGYSVSMPDSNTVAIGAILNDGNGTNTGHVRIYYWNGSIWMQKGTDIDGEASGDYSGCSVSMADSNTVTIGTYNNQENGIFNGHVRVYSWNGSLWMQKGTDIDGEAVGDRSGWSVSMPDSNTVAIGAIRNDGNGSLSGHVRVYCFLSTFSTINPVACDSLVSPSGNYTWTASSTYMDTISNAAGCDSVITVNLTINTVNVSVTNTSPSLIANALGATYQWLDCDNNYLALPGETGQSYTATMNGNYSVELTKNGCVDTSACVSIATIGIAENQFGDQFKIYPNPTNGNFAIDLGSTYHDITIGIKDLGGKVIQSRLYERAHLIELSIDKPSGIYLVNLKSGDKEAIVRLVKK